MDYYQRAWLNRKDGMWRVVIRNGSHAQVVCGDWEPDDLAPWWELQADSTVHSLPGRFISLDGVRYIPTNQPALSAAVVEAMPLLQAHPAIPVKTYIMQDGVEEIVYVSITKPTTSTIAIMLTSQPYHPTIDASESSTKR